MSASRWAELGRLGGRLASSMVSQTLRDALRSPAERIAARHEEQVRRAEQVVATLGRLKGAAMKLGQQAAMAAQHADLPDEARALLARLNQDAEPVPFDVVRATVEAELGGAIEDHFAGFDEAPLGSASLAQAHAARLPDGSDVVVKVMHAGIEDSVRADLLALKWVLRGGRVLGRSAEETDALFAELEERLSEELDYAKEADNVETFARLFAGDPRFTVPGVHRALCAGKVLTLDRVWGRPLDAFVRHAGAEVQQQAGTNLAEWFFESVFRHRVLHADPHPGNFLFADDGSVGVLDFGCVKRFDEVWIGQYARIVAAAFDGDRAAVLDATRQIESWAGDDPGAADAICDFCEAVVGPLREGRFTLGGPEDTLFEDLKPAVRQMWRYPEIRGHRHVVFLHRTLAGLYTIAKRLGTSGEWRPRLRPHLDHAMRVAGLAAA